MSTNRDLTIGSNRNHTFTVCIPGVLPGWCRCCSGSCKALSSSRRGQGGESAHHTSVSINVQFKMGLYHKDYDDDDDDDDIVVEGKRGTLALKKTLKWKHIYLI